MRNSDLRSTRSISILGEPTTLSSEKCRSFTTIKAHEHLKKTRKTRPPNPTITFHCRLGSITASHDLYRSGQTTNASVTVSNLPPTAKRSTLAFTTWRAAHGSTTTTRTQRSDLNTLLRGGQSHKTTGYPERCVLHYGGPYALHHTCT